MLEKLMCIILLGCFASGCDDHSPAQKPATQSSAASAVDLAPNPIYPIEVSIAGNAPLQQAADAAEARSKALDEVCKGLEIAAELAAQQPPGGGCPRTADSIGALTEVTQ